MTSLRARLVACTAVGTAAVMVAAGAAVYVLARDGLVDQFDRALVEKARLLASAVEIENGRLDVEFDDLDMSEFAARPAAAWLQIWSADGSVVYRSASLGAADLERPACAADSPAVGPARLPDGRTGRSVAFRFHPQVEADDEDRPAGAVTPPQTAAAGLRLVLARDTKEMDAVLARLRAVLLAVGTAAVAVAAAVLWVAVARGLRPVTDLAAKIEALDEKALARRIAIARAPAELGPVVEGLNRLLGRLEAAFERERAFSADVAHELRTPLAGLRSTLEVAASRTRTPAEYQQSLGQCLQLAAALSRMVEHLLALSRLDAGQVEVRPEPIVLADAVRDAWRGLARQAAGRRLDVQWHLDEDATVRTDSALAGLVVRNILENAVCYADEGGRVAIETVTEPDGAMLRVVNTGSRVPREKADAVFERFWRGDAARTDAGVHCGLGLALVRQAVAALGGQVAVRTAEGGLFEIEIRLPAQPPSSGSCDG